MLSSLLSLYIANTFPPQPNPYPLQNETSPAIIRMANAPIDILENKYFPKKNPYYISPLIDAPNAIAIDLRTGMVLFEKDSHVKKPIASITKLMTMLIIMEENALTEVVTISPGAAAIEGSQMFLQAGEKITIENLLYGAIIHSANDAAMAMAQHNAGSIAAFVDKMNKKALEIGLLNTHFANPTGLDSPNNYSSAYDVAKLSREILKYDFIKKAALHKEMRVTSVNGGLTHQLTTTNELLDSYLNIRGLKTGSTDSAGLCLVSIAEGPDGNKILTVVLNSPARFRETKILMDWVYRAYNW